MGKTIAEEYIIKITPELDSKKMITARNSVSKLVRQATLQEGRELKNQLSIEKINNQILKNEKLKYDIQLKQDKLNDKGKTTMVSHVSKLGTIVASLKIVYDLMKSITNAATEFSNKMITASSAFVDKDTRQLMATFGVSGQTATGLGAVMGTMGLATSDLRYMTPGQLSLFSQLMKQWTNGINSIDKESLAKFQEVTQTFQMQMASTQIRFQIELYKMLVSIAPQLEDFFNAIISFLNMLIDLLNNPVIKTALQVIIEVVAWIIKIITALAQVVTFDFSGALETLQGNTSDVSNYTTTNLTINANSTNTFNGDTNSMYGLATETQQTNSNIIMSTYNRNGKL